jgi:hypothetical protein
MWYFLDYNLELTVGSLQGLGLVELGAGCVQGTNALHTHPGQVGLTA